MTADLVSDFKRAARTLLADRGFTIPALVMLGLGMALCATVLIVINAYIIRTMPYPAADRLFWVRYAAPGQTQPRDLEKLDWSPIGRFVEQSIAWDLDMFYLLGQADTVAAPGAWVTPDFMTGLGVVPAIGRGFDATSFTPGSPQVALISHRLWLSRFAGDPQIVGRPFTSYVSDRPDEAETFTIIGVLPSGFWHVNPYTDVLAPLRAASYPYLVRLREGVAPAEAAAGIATLVRAGATGASAEWRPEIVSVHDQYVATLRPVLRLIGGAAGLVLLIACANVAGLLLIRLARRRKEIALRIALGAGRRGIGRLLIAEGLVMGAAAAAIGLLTSTLLMQRLAPLVERQLGRPAPGGVAGFSIDGTIIAGVAAMGLLTGLVVGLAPLAALRRLTSRSLREAGPTTTDGRATQRFRAGLIALEVAVSIALLCGALTMVRSVARLLDVERGIVADRVLAVSLTLRQRTYADAPKRLAFYERAIENLGSLGGVTSIGLASASPLQPARPQAIDVDAADGAVTARVSVAAVTAGYFTTLAVPVRAGRAFSPADRGGSEPVAIVSESMARRFWRDGDAIGARVSLAARDASTAAPVPHRVVGIAGDVRQTPGDEDLADLYVPMLQAPDRFSWVYLRTSGTPMAWQPAVGSAFAAIDPELVVRSQPLQAGIDEQSARPRFLASLLGLFAAVATLLALVGVHSVAAYAVKQREREIAIRLAIGAAPLTIVYLFLRQGGAMIGAGLVAGVVGAVGAGRALESQLFGVQPAEPSTLMVAVTMFAAAGIAAILGPASRAAAASPVAALKGD